MSFYQELSRYYDEIFAVDDEEMRFVKGLLRGKADLLDVGCGTGNKTVHFSAGASSIVAIDMDEGMIAKAQSVNSRDSISYSVLKMQDAGTAFQKARFDGILCLGNTLVHLTSSLHIRAFLRAVHGLLRPGGVFVLQILNYDRLMARNITSLPALETPNVRFTRGYAWDGADMHFVTSLHVRATGKILRNDIVLYPLRKEELTTMLLAAGFPHPGYFGSYQGAPHGDDSFVTIARCEKV